MMYDTYWTYFIMYNTFPEAKGLVAVMCKRVNEKKNFFMYKKAYFTILSLFWMLKVSNFQIMIRLRYVGFRVHSEELV